MTDVEKFTSTPAATADGKPNDNDDTQQFYPPPTSSYYFGPPDAGRAFGEEVTGKVGVHLPKEIVRIERDYSAGELPQFYSSFPLELEGRISPTSFSEIINDINTLLIKAHDPTRIWIENSIAIATLYLSTMVWKGHYQRVSMRNSGVFPDADEECVLTKGGVQTMDELQQMIERVNGEVLEKVGLRLVDPRRSAFLFVELEYY